VLADPQRERLILHHVRRLGKLGVRVLEHATEDGMFLDRFTNPRTKSCMRTPSEDSAAAFAHFNQATSKNVLKNVHDSQCCQPRP
jgi:hypothetical protein